MPGEKLPDPIRKNRDAPRPSDTEGQGILRDQRGQEQPADKKRAQQANQNEPGGDGKDG